MQNYKNCEEYEHDSKARTRTFGKLFETDKQAESIFYQAVDKSHFGEYEDEFLAHILFCCLDERVMEWGIVDMQDIVDAFDKLDSEYPYESGFQPHQAFTAKVIDQEENAVVVKLSTKYGEKIGVTRIYD